MSEKTEYDELLKVGKHYDITFKDGTTAHNCFVTIKDADIGMVKLRVYGDGSGLVRIYSVNIDTIDNFSDVRKLRYYWQFEDNNNNNGKDVARLLYSSLSEEEIAHNPSYVFYDDHDSAITHLFEERIIPSKDPKNWVVEKAYGDVICKYNNTASAAAKRLAGDNTAGWEGPYAKLLLQMMEDCKKNNKKKKV